MHWIFRAYNSLLIINKIGDLQTYLHADLLSKFSHQAPLIPVQWKGLALLNPHQGFQEHRYRSGRHKGYLFWQPAFTVQKTQ